MSRPQQNNQLQDEQEQEQEPPRRTSRRNNVSGPTSALSSYLRERGIASSNVSRWTRRQQPNNQSDPPPPPSDPSAPQDPHPQPESNEISTPLQTEQTLLIAIEPIQEKKQNRQNDAKKTKKRKSKKGNSDSDDDFILPQAGPSKFIPPSAVSLIKTCVQCSCRFTAQGKMRLSEHPLCLKCRNKANDPHGLKNSNALPTPTKGKPAKRRAKRKKVMDIELISEESSVVPCLQDICIKVVANYIDKVYSFGDVSFESLDRICKIICRRRKLNDEILRLFLSPLQTEITLYDCADISEIGFHNIVDFCFNLEVLDLHCCSKLSDDVLAHMGKRLSSLSQVTFRGCYLASDIGFESFLSSLGHQLMSFCVEEANLMTVATLDALSRFSVNHVLKELRLTRCWKLDQEALKHWLEFSYKLTGKKNCFSFTELQLSETFRDAEDSFMLQLITEWGSGLRELILDDFPNITSCLFTDGIFPHCSSLSRLTVRHCPKVQTLGLVSSENSPAPPISFEKFPYLSHLDFSHTEGICDEEWAHYLCNYGSNLSSLYLNRTEASHSAINVLTETSRSNPFLNMTDLDLSWCRIVDDEILEKLVSSIPNLRRISLWGCHLVTEFVYGKKLTNKKGQLIQLVGCEAVCRV